MEPISSTDSNSCSKCGKICKDKRGLSVHEARCSGLSSFDCECCGGSFQSASHLKRHHGSCDEYKEKMILKECDDRIKLIQLECDDRIKLIQLECDARIRSIQSEYENRSNVLHSELVNKIMNIDKEMQTSLTSKLKAEKEEWSKNHNQEIEILRKQNSSLVRDKEYLQVLISNLDNKSISEDDSTEYLVSKNSEDKQIEYVYIIQEREFVKEGHPLYKIGRTRQEPNKRYVSYPKGSYLHMMLSVPNCQEAEKAIKSIFKKKFKHEPSIGVEYFEGNVEEMKKEYLKLLV